MGADHARTLGGFAGSLRLLGSFSIAAAAAAMTTGCGPRIDTIPPAWPPHSGVDVHSEIVATISACEEAPAQGIVSPWMPPIPVPSPAFAPLPELIVDVPGVQAREGEVEGLYYLEVVLGDADLEEELPLIIVLHGRGDSPSIPGGPFEGLSRPVRIVLPRAPEPLGDGWTWLPVSVTEHKPELLSMTLFEMAKRLASAIEILAGTLPTSGKPIVTGFSQGGMLTYTLAVYHPSVVGIALPLAGWLPPLLVPEPDWPEIDYPVVRAMHGSDDPIIPLELARESVDEMVGMGADAALYEFEGVGHEMTPAMDSLFHGWLESVLAGAIPPLPSEPFEQIPVPEPAAPVSAPAAGEPGT